MSRLRSVSMALLTASALTPAYAEGERQISGSLTYLARIALPPDALLLVEARGRDGQSLDRAVIETLGKQVPLDLSLSIPASTAAEVRASIVTAEGTRWVWQPEPIAPDNTPITLGEGRLRPFAGIGYNLEFLCDGVATPAARFGDKMLIDPGSDGIDPWQLAVRPDGSFVSETGDRAAQPLGTELLLTEGGETRATCQPRPVRPIETWYAKATGGGWDLDFAEGKITLRREGAEMASYPLPTPVINEGLDYLLTSDGRAPVRVSLYGGICENGSRLLYPHSVTVKIGDKFSTGCGGDPLALLTGQVWRVGSIRGEALTGEAVPTLNFFDDMTLAGNGSCNSYRSSFTLDEEGLQIQPGASTMMACAEPLMAQERSFHAALAEVVAYVIDGDGTLSLYSRGGEALRAKRSN